MLNNGDLYSTEWVTIDPETIIQQAIAKLADDAGAVLESDVIEAFKTIYNENPANYARYRLAVKNSKQITMGQFDKLIAKQPESQPLAQKTAFNLFPTIEVWDSPVNGEQLLNEIRDTIKQYIIADNETIIAATLWVAYTWFIDVVSYAPIANITAPEKRCGKTRLLSVLKRLSYQAFVTANISAAALFRLIELHNPTLLIDEVDTFLALDDSMRGVINAGFTRESAYIVRCVGEDLEPTPFNVWGAKALCGIGKIADTLQDRSITLKLRRRITGETILNVDKSDPKQWVILRSKLARFAQDHKLQLINTHIQALPQLNDRANDCWEPLRQVAQLAGGHWQDTAIKAALYLNGEQDENDSIKIELLREIKNIFDTKRIERVFSHDLASYLNEDNEASWIMWNKGKGMTPTSLAKNLRDFGIVSKSIRIGLDNVKGYAKEQFKDTFNRYLVDKPTNSYFENVTASQDKSHNNYSVTQSTKNDLSVTAEKTLQPNSNKDCDVVTNKTTYLVKGYKGYREVEEKEPKNNPTMTHSINDLLEDDKGIDFDL